MTLNPDNIFPVEKLDATIKSQDVSVEETLGMVGHVRALTRKRNQWRYVNVEEPIRFPPSKPGEEPRYLTKENASAVTVREFFELPVTAAVYHNGHSWAAWAGKGDPTTDAFEKDEPIVTEGVTTSSITQEIAERWARDSGNSKDVDAQASRPRLAAELVAGKTAETGNASETGNTRETGNAWYYSSKILTARELRAHFGFSAEAPFQLNQQGDIAAVWSGTAPPGKDAFPVVSTIRTESRSEAREREVDLLNPEDELHAIAMRLFELSERNVDNWYGVVLRDQLLPLSDQLHAHASRVTIARKRLAVKCAMEDSEP